MQVAIALDVPAASSRASELNLGAGSLTSDQIEPKTACAAPATASNVTAAAAPKAKFAPVALFASDKKDETTNCVRTVHVTGGQTQGCRRA